jgi:hypothetical protein
LSVRSERSDKHKGEAEQASMRRRPIDNTDSYISHKTTSGEIIQKKGEYSIDSFYIIRATGNGGRQPPT